MPVKSTSVFLIWLCLAWSLASCSAAAGEAVETLAETASGVVSEVNRQAVAATPDTGSLAIRTATPPPEPVAVTPAAGIAGPASLKPGCGVGQGRLEAGSLSSARLPEPLEYRLYLPPCYDQEPAQSYPVLYLLHGQGFAHDQWDRLGVDESAEALILKGEIAPLLIVLPYDRSWAQPDEDPFGQALVEELIPHIDSAYRTLPERRYRAIGGLSRGAAWAVHLGLSRWQYFGAIGAHSLPVFFSDASKIPAWLEAIPAESLPRIYLDIGEKDRPEVLESARWFGSLLSAEGIPHEWHLFSGYHEESYWQAHLEQYLRWYASEW